MEQTFFQKHRKIIILIGVIVGVILAVTGFLIIALVILAISAILKIVASRRPKKDKSGDLGLLQTDVPYGEHIQTY